ncbi:MAG: hypothetical protein EP343_03235 [Deltaproteobacteria bacterium]|nr:MAG: hypothetical protein EP343_03235 [Deltaproteobacteria bacterium]
MGSVSKSSTHKQVAQTMPFSLKPGGVYTLVYFGLESNSDTPLQAFLIKDNSPTTSSASLHMGNTP